jgi:hypothetical protein
MWWKLTLIALVTILLIVVVQPIMTHAVKVDIQPTGKPTNPMQPGIFEWFSSVYVTPTSLLITIVILAVAAFLALRVIRG